jgi:hypothetical protein
VFSVLGLTFGVDELLEEGASGGPHLVADAVGFAGDTAAAPWQRLGRVADAVDDDGATLAGTPSWRRDDAGAGCGLCG